MIKASLICLLIGMMFAGVAFVGVTLEVAGHPKFSFLYLCLIPAIAFGILAMLLLIIDMLHEENFP